MTAGNPMPPQGHRGTASRSSAIGTILSMLVTVVGGAAFGVLDRILGHGPPWAFDLSNVAVFWLGAAFLAGTAAPTLRRGASAGLVVLAAALGGYYAYMYIAEHNTSVHYLASLAAPWVLAALVVGPLFGALGAEWRLRRSPICIVALVAAFCLDGMGYAAIAGARDPINVEVHLALILMGAWLGVTLVRLRRRWITSTPRRS